MKRTFIYTDDKSNKFWTIEINGDSYTVTYGKVGTAGQTQTKDFTDEAACQKAADKLIAEKTKKGYVEESSEGNEAVEIPKIEDVEENQIIVDVNNAADMKRVLNMLIANAEHWDEVAENGEGIEYGQLVDGEFEMIDTGDFISSEEAFFAAAAAHKELQPLIEKYAKAVDPNQFMEDDVRMGMNAIFQLALNNEKYTPSFIEHHRKVRPGGGETQMDHIIDLLSDSDNGLKLLAACAMYAIDQPDIEINLEYWIEEHVGDDEKKQAKLFKYIMLEAIKVPENNEFRNNYVIEALDAMGVDYDEDTLAEILEDIDPKNLPTLDDLGEGSGHDDDLGESTASANTTTSQEDREVEMYLPHVKHTLSNARKDDLANENWHYGSVYGIGGHAFMDKAPERLLTDKAKQFLSEKDYYYFDGLLRFFSQTIRSKILGENSLSHLKQFMQGLDYYLPGVDLNKAAEMLYNDSEGEYIPKRKEIIETLNPAAKKQIQPFSAKPFKVVVKGIEFDIPAEFGKPEQKDPKIKVHHELIDGTDYLFLVEGRLALENNDFELGIMAWKDAYGSLVKGLCIAYEPDTIELIDPEMKGFEVKKCTASAKWKTYMRKTMRDCTVIYGVTGGSVTLGANLHKDKIDYFMQIARTAKPVSAKIKTRLQELSK